MPDTVWLKRMGQAFLVLAAFVLGCGPAGPKTYKVSGTVTFDGQLVESGEIILLDPAEVEPPVAGPIVNGEFDFASTAGVKRVEIRASRDTGKMGPLGPVFDEYIPARYNSDSHLKEEVVPGGKNRFELKLEATAR